MSVIIKSKLAEELSKARKELRESKAKNRYLEDRLSRYRSKNRELKDQLDGESLKKN